MKNKEKYINEILEIFIEDRFLAVDKNTNKPRKCLSLIGCANCLFNNRCNGESRKQWLEAEDKHNFDCLH